MTSVKCNSSASKPLTETSDSLGESGGVPVLRSEQFTIGEPSNVLTDQEEDALMRQLRRRKALRAFSQQEMKEAELKRQLQAATVFALSQLIKEAAPRNN